MDEIIDPVYRHIEFVIVYKSRWRQQGHTSISSTRKSPIASMSTLFMFRLEDILQSRVDLLEEPHMSTIHDTINTLQRQSYTGGSSASTRCDKEPEKHLIMDELGADLQLIAHVQSVKTITVLVKSPSSVDDHRTNLF